MDFRVTLTNPKGLRLTVIVGNGTNEQPYDRAEREVNADTSHSKYGPWKAYQTDRNS